MPYCNNQQARGRRSTRRLQPRLEGLEERIVLSTFRVNTTLDTVAVNFKNGQDSIGAHLAAIGDHGRRCSRRFQYDHRSRGPVPADDSRGQRRRQCQRRPRPQGKDPDQRCNSSATIIDGNDLDRVFQVLGGKISISN